jgi:thymidylate kinase
MIEEPTENTVARIKRILDNKDLTIQTYRDELLFAVAEIQQMQRVIDGLVEDNSKAG